MSGRVCGLAAKGKGGGGGTVRIQRQGGEGGVKVHVWVCLWFHQGRGGHRQAGGRVRGAGETKGINKEQEDTASLPAS